MTAENTQSWPGSNVDFGPDDGPLATAIWGLPAGAVLRLAPGTYNGPLVLPMDLKIVARSGLGSVTIVGARPIGAQGATLSLEGARRVQLQNLILRGPSHGLGAVVQIYQRADVRIDNCVITGGRGRGQGGGGVDLQAGTLRLHRCRITQNAALQGGGIRAAGRVVLAVRNCVFAGNRAEGVGGGGLFATFGAQVDLLGCSWTGNRARFGASILGGGGLGAQIRLRGCLLAEDEGQRCLVNHGLHPLSVGHSVVPYSGDDMGDSGHRLDVNDTVCVRKVAMSRDKDSPYSAAFPVILRAIGDAANFAADERRDLYGRPREAIWVGAVG